MSDSSCQLTGWLWLTVIVWSKCSLHQPEEVISLRKTDENEISTIPIEQRQVLPRNRSRAPYNYCKLIPGTSALVRWGMAAARFVNLYRSG